MEHFNQCIDSLFLRCKITLTCPFILIIPSKKSDDTLIIQTFVSKSKYFKNEYSSRGLSLSKSSITLYHQTLMKEAPDPRSEASFGESKLGERLIDLSKRYVCSVILIPGNLYYKHLILQNISKP